MIKNWKNVKKYFMKKTYLKLILDLKDKWNQYFLLINKLIKKNKLKKLINKSNYIKVNHSIIWKIKKKRKKKLELKNFLF